MKARDDRAYYQLAKKKGSIFFDHKAREEVRAAGCCGGAGTERQRDRDYQEDTCITGSAGSAGSAWKRGGATAPDPRKR